MGWQNFLLYEVHARRFTNLNPGALTPLELLADELSTASRLALQLHLCFEICTLEMGPTSLGLVSAPPQRPGDDASGLDAAVGELDGDAADFLDRPADQAGRFCGSGGSVFLSGTALAW